MTHHVEVVGAHGVQHPAMHLAQRRNDAIADARSYLEAQCPVEAPLRRLASFRIGVPRVRLRRQRVQQPEQCP